MASAGAPSSRIVATSLTSCVSTQRTTSAMVRSSRAAASSSGASSLAAVAYQNSPSAVVPSTFAVSQRSAATRQACRQSVHPGTGDHELAGTPVQPVGSIHQTWPRRWRAATVSRNRSLFTLAATTGPRHPRMAGTARLVVLPLWVGPTTTSDCAGSAATPTLRVRPGRTPRRSRPTGGVRAPTSNVRRSRRRPQRAPRRAPPGPLRRCSSCDPSRYEIPATSAPPSATGSTTAATPLTALRRPPWPRRCRRSGARSR